jgi:DNA end-binding protein Ku
MARSIWTGAIGFGLVHVPVRLYSATEDKDVHFHQLQKDTGKRIHMQRVTDDGDVVDYDDVVKGYELSKGKYVMLTDEEMEAAEPGRSKTIEIEDFVDLAEIDPIEYEKTYYVFPDERADAAKPFVLLRKALADSERIGIGRFVMRDHQYLVALRPYGDVLAMETMYFPDEVRDVKKVADPPKGVKVNNKELDMALRLVDSLTTTWDPSRYHDTHREKLLDIIDRKAKGEEIVVEETEETESNVVDLMEVLRRSLEGASGKKRASKSGGRTKKSSGTRASKKAPAKKKAAKKSTKKPAKRSKASSSKRKAS